MLSPKDIVFVGGRLTVNVVLAAYHEGTFPWFPHDSTDIWWWNPDPRFVLDVAELHVGRTVRKARKKFTYTFDTAFDQVIEECATKRYEARTCEGTDRTDTWITPKMMKVYRQLHRRGFAHSVEGWREGRLVGGLYGICLGTTFFGESMFSHETNASKACLVTLCEHLKKRGVSRVDCQMETPLMKYMGGKYVSRREFCRSVLLGLDENPTVREKWT